MLEFLEHVRMYWVDVKIQRFEFLDKRLLQISQFNFLFLVKVKFIHEDIKIIELIFWGYHLNQMTVEAS